MFQAPALIPRRWEDTDLKRLINCCGATDSRAWDLYDINSATGEPRPLLSEPGTDPRCEDKGADACGESEHLVETDCHRVDRGKRQINRCCGRQCCCVKQCGKTTAGSMRKDSKWGL
jgi:hypothetical protein